MKQKYIGLHDCLPLLKYIAEKHNLRLNLAKDFRIIIQIFDQKSNTEIEDLQKELFIRKLIEERFYPN